MNEDISVAAAILAAEFIRKGELKEGDAYLLWRRFRVRMQSEVGKEAVKPEASADSPDTTALFNAALADAP